MNTAVEEYLVYHGTAGHVGRFRPLAEGPFARGESVVVRSSRGLEVGAVLRAARPGPSALPDSFIGDLLRRATAGDVAAVDSGRTAAQRLAVEGERLAGELGLPLAIVDAEVLLEGAQAVLHVLKLAPCEEGPWLADLGERHGLIVRIYDLAREAPTPAAAADHLEDFSCGNCGEGGCGEGGCGSCGTDTDHDRGGCTSCSSGSAKELTAYFAGLREQMERRTSLL